MPFDLIDTLAGLSAEHPLTVARDARPAAKTAAQASYDALFAPEHDAEFPIEARKAVAFYVAALTQEPATLAHYRALAKDLPDYAALEALTNGTEQQGPWGKFPAGPLSAEDTIGVDFPQDALFEPRLLAALRHAHLLTLHPRDAKPAHLAALLDAGWTETAIVTLSQLVAFLAFQIRIVHGLKAAGKTFGA